MRARNVVLLRLVVVGLLASSATTLATPDKKQAIDAKANAAKLEVWKDDVGQFYVVPVFGAYPFGEAKRWVFFGDGKDMYQQRLHAVGTAARRSRSRSFRRMTMAT